RQERRGEEQRPRDNESYRNDQPRNDDGYRGNDRHRNDDGYRNNNDGYRNNDRYRNYERYDAHRSYRNNDRIWMHGRLNRYYHERGGYRVWIDGGRYSYWVPEVYWRPNWRVGIDLSLGGIFRDGVIYSDVYDDPYYDDSYYGGAYSNDILSGYVDRVDYRTGTMWVRDGRSGREFVVDTRSIDPRYNRIDARDVQRGDRVTFAGSFTRGGVFIADRIDSINTRY